MNKYIKYLLYIIALIPPFIFRDYTPSNELRYVSIIDEAIRNGSMFCFYNHGEIYADKPPLYFWLLMAFKHLFGSHQMWAMGLLSVIPSVAIVAVMDRWTKTYAGLRNTSAAGLALLTTVMYIGSTLVLRMDILMIFFIVLSLYKFHKLYIGKGTTLDKWSIPVYIFLALFTKGPMGLIIPLLSMATFLGIKRELKSFGKYFSYKQLLLLLSLCAVWFTLIWVEGGSPYLNNILFKQTVGRSVNAFHHKAPFYYYIRNIFHTMAPWILLYLVVFVTAIRKRMLNTDLSKLFVSAIVSTFIVLSIISSKLDIYLVAVYPFIVYLAFILLEEQKINKWHKAFVIIPATIFALLLPVSFFAVSMIPFPVESLLLPRIGLTILMVGCIYAIYLTIKQGEISKAVVSVSGSFLAMVFVASFALNQFNDHVGFRNLAHKVESLSADGEKLSFYKLRGCENLDVFIGTSPQEIDSIEELESNEDIGILMLRVKEINRDNRLKEWTKTLNPIDTVGDVIIFRKIK